MKESAQPSSSILPGEKEMSLIKHLLLLPLILTVTERDLLLLKQSNLKLKPAYIAFYQTMADDIHMELVHVRRSIKEAGIRVYHIEQHHSGIRCDYDYRGYHGEFGMLRSYVKAEIGAALTKYLRSRLKQRIAEDGRIL